MDFYIEDFTEENYKRLLKIAKQKYSFITYGDIKEDLGSVVIWRHDIDYSVHRAYKLALIETELHVKSTFFLYLHSSMYNLLEREITTLTKEIIKLGHNIGLHFEPAHYNLTIGDTDGLKMYLNYEKKILENLFETDIEVFSFHNPDAGGWMAFEDFDVCGMVNTYSRYLKDNYCYCSDSDGYWRYNRLEDVLSGDHKKLHILLHPEWWTPDKMTPRERVRRCIDGRSKKCYLLYDKNMENMGRLNVK